MGASTVTVGAHEDVEMQNHQQVDDASKQHPHGQQTQQVTIGVSDIPGALAQS